MASRAGVSEVGSIQWISNEVADAHNKETDHFEDFTIAIRNELEWLNEHMAEIFHQGSNVDITELYKTPGKLRGKTPRHPHKINRILEEENNEIFFGPRSNAQRSIEASEETTTDLIQTQVSDGVQSPVSTPDLIKDCGEWSGSSGAPSLAGSFAIITAEAVERSSPAKKPSYDVAPHVVAEIAEQRNFSDATRKSFVSALEDSIDNRSDVSSPAPSRLSQAKELEDSSNEEVENSLPTEPSASHATEDSAPEKQNPRDNPSVDTMKTNATTVTASQSSVVISPSRTPANHKHNGSSAIDRGYTVSPVQISSPMVVSSPISPVQPREAPFTPKGVPADQAVGSDTPSEAASPTAVPTRSSMNFASLPARETLTHKKSMGGSNVASRISHVDDRTSFFGRLTGGKSLGASNTPGEPAVSEIVNIVTSNSLLPANHQPSDDDDEDDDDLNEQLRLAEKNKASVMQLAEKTSTQRLNEKISQLSQQGTNRLSKSISASSFSISNQVDDLNPSKSAAVLIKPSNEEVAVEVRESAQSDDDDWIPSRPHISRTQTAPNIPVPASPIRLVNPSPQKTVPPRFPSKVGQFTPAKAFASPATSTKLPVPSSAVKSVFPPSAVKYPILPTDNLTAQSSHEATTPSKIKPSQDVDVSTAKKNQANIFSFAKQLLWRSGRSESPKPPQDPAQASPKKQESENALAKISETGVKAIVENTNSSMYPDLQAANHKFAYPSDNRAPPKRQVDEPKQHVKPKGAENVSKLLTYGDAVKRDVQVTGPSSAVIEGINLVPENADDLLQSPQVSDEDPVLPGSPFSELGTSDGEDDRDDDSDHHPQTSKPVNRSPQKISRKSSSRSQTPTRQPGLKAPPNRPSLQSKASDVKKPIRGLFGVKDGGIGKPKPASSNIRLVTASQREMDQRKGPSIPIPNTATLANALADSFGPPKESAPRPASAMSTASNQSLRAPKSIAALNSAAKAQKREQEERERKVAQKQEIERRRQENLRREEARREEERKQQTMKKTQRPVEKVSDDERKRPVNTAKSSQSVAQPSKLLSKTTPFSHKAPLVDRSLPSKTTQDVKRQPKRMFQGDDDHNTRKEESNSSKMANPPEHKRRKTEDIVENPAPSTSAPPIRQSTARKENLPPSKIGGIFSQDYTPAATHHSQYGSGSSLVKSSVQVVKSGTALPHVDAIKYSHDKLKFGNMTTPAPQKHMRPFPTASRESPVYPNPETIDLPEIHTDSEDEVDEKSFHVPKWADSPELRQALQDQLGIDPETIFGPIAPLSMEDIFKGRADRAKFRARTSSANWSGSDRLTAAEIEADRIERQRILDNGGWTYQKPQ